MMFSTVSLKNTLQFYCIFNSISLYISLQFYRMAIRVLVAFQAAFDTQQLVRLGAIALFPGDKVAGSVRVTTPLVPSLQFTDLHSFKN
jgi:hypothetical protein